jgi:truncated hemoglobin YjbI
MQTTADATDIQEAVERFIDRVLTDPALERFRAKIDVGSLRRRARMFVIEVLGGPPLYRGLDHEPRPQGVDDAEFERITCVLVESLAGVGVSSDVLVLARRRAEELRPVVVTA